MTRTSYITLLILLFLQASVFAQQSSEAEDLHPSSAQYPFSYDEIRALPDIEEPIFEWTAQERISWLDQQMQARPEPIHQYNYHRLLVATHFFSGDEETAAQLCSTKPPMFQDIYYRWWCIDATEKNETLKLEKKMTLSLEAQQVKRPEIAASILSEIGWRQSQMGDIGAAFVSYEKALDIVPKDDFNTTIQTMFNVASLYIVHGDDQLVNKGIELLHEIRRQHLEKQNKALADNNKAAAEQHLQQQVISLYNIGIAYVLHLHDYQKALKLFDEVLKLQHGFEVDAASFAAIAAAELGMRDKVDYYIQRAGERVVADKIVNDYLTCYRQLALRYFDPGQTIDICFKLSPNTTTEVTLDLAKRISALKGAPEEIHGLRLLHELYLDKIEPELKQRASTAASNAELKRLEKESELKSEILAKEQALKVALASEKETQQFLFLLAIIVMLLVVLVIVLQLRQKKKLAHQYEQLSLKDGLTNLGNRRFLEHNIVRELAYIKRHHKFDHTSMLGIYIFDLDHFKQINDHYGHDAGDAVLVEFSKRLKDAIRETDLLTRWGGEEFIYVARVKTEQEVFDLAERLRGLIKNNKFKLPSGDSIQVTCTIGAVQFPFFADETKLVPWQQLISLADMALYWGKQYRDCWSVLVADELESPEQITDCLKQPLEKLLKQKKLKLTTSATE